MKLQDSKTFTQSLLRFLVKPKRRRTFAPELRRITSRYKSGTRLQEPMTKEIFNQTLPRKTAVYGLRNTILLSTGLLLLAMGISEFYALAEMVGNSYLYLARSLASTTLLIGGIMIFLPRPIIEFGDTKFFLVIPVIGILVLIALSLDSEAYFLPALFRNALNVALPVMSIWCLKHKRNRKLLYKTLKVILSMAILGQAWEYFSWQWADSNMLDRAQELFSMSRFTTKAILIFWGSLHLLIVGLFWSKNDRLQIISKFGLLSLGLISMFTWFVVGIANADVTSFFLYYFMNGVSVIPQIILPLFFIFNDRRLRFTSRMLFDLVA